MRLISIFTRSAALPPPARRSDLILAALNSAPFTLDRAHPASRLFGGLLGCGLTYAVMSRLPLVPSTVLSSLLLGSAASLCGRRHLSPLGLWGLIGAAAGALLGMASVLAQALQEVDIEGDIRQRCLSLLAPAVAGLVAGLCLSNDAESADRRHPRDVLRSASGLTTGLFAVLVTLTFVHSGLDVARTFSSRLSTSLTILVASVAVPGWLAHQLRPMRHRRAHD